MSSQRRNLRSSARRRRQQRQRQSVAESTSAGDWQVVDLTCANYEEQFVDLTDLDGSPVVGPLRTPNNSPIVIPATPTATPMVRHEHDAHMVNDGGASDEDLARNEDNLRDRDLHLISDSDEDLPPVPFKITSKPRTKRSANTDQTASSSAGLVSHAHCPICLESFTEVKSSGCRVMATTCGHVFCEECLRGVLDGLHGCRKCPTCRKKISARSVHPLYI